MDPQLENAILLQDLDSMIREIADPGISGWLGELGFPAPDLGRLEAIRAEIAGSLEREVLRLYSRLSKRYRQAIVPVLNDACFGCFLTQPTQFTSDGNSRLRCCHFCGRILYFTDDHPVPAEAALLRPVGAARA